MKKPKKSNDRSRSGKRGTEHSAVRYSDALVQAVVGKKSAGEKLTADEFDGLMRYVVYLTSPEHPAYLEHPLKPEELASIEKACREKPEWARVLSDLRGEYAGLLRAFEKSSFATIPLPTLKEAPGRRFIGALGDFFFPPVRKPRFALAVAVMLLAIAGIFVGTSVLITPSYYADATIKPAAFTVRGGSTVLAAGIDAMQREDLRTASESFQRIIDEHSASDDALLARYFEASVRLMKSKHTVLGLFPSFDRTGVDDGIAQLTALIALVENSGKSSMLEEQCRFMLGQAYLMKNDIGRARPEFSAVVRLHGTRARQSEEILALLPQK